MSFTNLFAIGVSGVNAFTAGLNAIAQNIANSTTTGYKRLRTEFSDLIPTDAPALNEAVGAPGVGTGVAAAHRLIAGEQGSLARTDEETNIAVAGDGFFIVSREAEASARESLFTRAGDFSADADGDLVNGAGFFLQGAPVAADGSASFGSPESLQTVNINQLPAGVSASALGALTGVAIDADGYVVARYANGGEHALFRIPLALFANAEGLEEADATSFRASSQSGAALLSAAREANAGAIEGAAVELSTVDIAREFSTLIETQRAYATNARVISAADELWRVTVETAA